MAVFTPLTDTDATRIFEAHGLGPVIRVIPIPAGSVNSNFFIEGPRGRRFVRIYEEQGADGVAYEWRLLEHLEAAGVPVPARVPGPGPGVLTVEGKPTAVFELVGGAESCQAGITPARARRVGAALAKAHVAARDFPLRRAGRFGLAAIGQRLRAIDPGADPGLTPLLARLARTLERSDRARDPDLPAGVIHGDLFRDNVRFEGDRIAALIDWESASDGPLAYDVMVTVLAFCFGDDLHMPLARALVSGYQSVRPLTSAEQKALRTEGVAAALRFTATRITDYHLRTGTSPRVHKDYRRFVARLDRLEASAPEELARELCA